MGKLSTPNQVKVTVNVHLGINWLDSGLSQSEPWMAQNVIHEDESNKDLKLFNLEMKMVGRGIL